MKKHILLITVLLGSLAMPAMAQVQVGVNVNIGMQPVWGPVGYEHADYYYIPDIETYYNIPLHQYTWFDHGRWVSDYALPPRYAGYDLYHSYKVVINEPNPWFHHDRYRRQYMEFRGRRDQPIIRDSRDERYFANPGHPDHRAWREHQQYERRDGYREERREEHRDEHRDEHHEERRDR